MESKIVKTFNEKVQDLVEEEKDRERLYSLLQAFQEHSDVGRLILELRNFIDEPQLIPLYNDIRPLIPAKHQIDYDRMAPRRNLEKMRVIRLSRRSSEGLGFSVRGGLEHEVGIYVSDVDQESLAYKKGLRTGDEIVRLNGFTISQAIHQEVLNLIKARNELVLKVRSVGMIPVKDKPGAHLTWKYVDMDPPEISQVTGRQVSGNQAKVGEEVNLFINIPLDGGLGCSICSGPSDQPGIFIQSLKRGGLAMEAGLEVGDQVLKVNGTTFSNVTHSQAIVAFKGSKHLDMVVRKGTGINLFKPQNDPNLTLMEQPNTEQPKSSLKKHKETDNKRKTTDKVESVDNDVSFIADTKQDDLIQEAIKVIDEKEDMEVKVQRLNTTAEVHKVPTSFNDDGSEKKKKTWLFEHEEKLEDAGELQITLSKLNHVNGGQKSQVKKEMSHPSKDIKHDNPKNFAEDDRKPKSNIEKEGKSRLYRKKHHDSDNLYATIPADVGSPAPEDRSPAPHRVSTGFDQPPFPEATTEFRGSPTYDMTIPTSESKVALNPKIYKPIEIQSFKNQTAVRPSKSPTYMSEVQSNYRIQKPVLLHPTRPAMERERRASITDAIAGQHSTHAHEGEFIPTRVFTNEQIAGRQIKQVIITKEGSADLGVLIESSLDRINVAEIYHGGALHRQGGIHIGDQLMMVERHLVIGKPIEQVHSLLKEEFRSPKPTLAIAVAKAPPSDHGNEILPRPDYFDIPISNLDDFMDEDDVEICMYNDDVPVTII